MKKKFTKLEKQLLDVVQTLCFYGSHSDTCAKYWKHNLNEKCTCAVGRGLVNGSIILNKYGMGFYQVDADKEWIPEK